MEQEKTAAEEKVKRLPECSLAKTNKSCALLIDRATPVAPPTIQMYSGESITVVVQGPNGFERYFLDYQSGLAALKPDVASSVVQGLLPSLQKAGAIKALALGMDTQAQVDVCKEIGKAPVPTPGKEVNDMVDLADIWLGQLAEKAIDIYQKLEWLVAPDSLTPTGTAKLNKHCKLQDCISAFQDSEIAFSTKVTKISKDATLSNTKNPTYDADAQGIAKLTAKQKSADTIAGDLQGYKMVTRTITYALNAYNLVSYPQEASPDPTKKKSLATITVNFAETPKSINSALRWEASAGAFFSSLPIRSFSAAPVFTSGVITDKKVTQNLLYPTVVPFAAGNYRLTNDLPWSRWKSNIYWTGAAGINPNTVSADFATGLSLSWRALMVSGLCHFGHDVRLTQGLKVGESLGAGFNGSLSTETHWTTNFALGLSVRVPSISGR